MGSFIGNIAIKTSDTKKLLELMNELTPEFYITVPVLKKEFSAIFPSEISDSQKIAKTLSKKLETLAISGEVYDSDVFEFHIYNVGEETVALALKDQKLEFKSKSPKIDEITNCLNFLQKIEKLNSEKYNLAESLYKDILKILNLNKLAFLCSNSYDYLEEIIQFPDEDDDDFEWPKEIPHLIAPDGKSTKKSVNQKKRPKEKEVNETLNNEQKVLQKLLSDKIGINISDDFISTNTTLFKYRDLDRETYDKEYIFYSHDESLYNKDILEVKLNRFKKDPYSFIFYEDNRLYMDLFNNDMSVTFQFMKIWITTEKKIVLLGARCKTKMQDEIIKKVTEILDMKVLYEFPSTEFNKLYKTAVETLKE